MLVELDRLYLLAGPKEEFEESDPSLEQVRHFNVHVNKQLIQVAVCNSQVAVQDFEEAEQQAKQRRVADAELAATQVLKACRVHLLAS